MKKLVTILALVLVTGTALFAQTPAWSWYVSDKGNDNDNNGRSPEQAFRTFQKAFTSAAASNVKTITVVGKTTVTGSAFLYEGSGAAEILLTGQDENAQMDFRLSYGEKAPPSKLRIESLRITDEFTIGGPVNLTLGRDAVFEDVEFKGNGKDLSITMEANAVVRQTKYPYSSVTISEGAFLMKDNALISGAGASVSGVYNTASFAMQDNAKIENSQGDGVDLVRCDFTMMDKASITGCRDTGIVVNWRSTATLQDNASITGCGRTTSSFTEPPLMGGGIRVGGDAVVVLMGNTVISGNKARQGGGIYFTSDGTKEQIYDNSTPTLSRPDDLRKANQRISARYRGSITSLIIQDKVQITGNEAGEGGGIYAVRGSASITVTFTTNDDGRIPKASPAVTAPAVTGVVMNGGTISGNKADYGAGVYAVEALEVEHVRYTPPAQAYGKDFFVYNLGSYIEDAGRKSPVPAFTLNGGSVTGNEAQFVGGGVYAKVKGAYQAGRGTLSGNTAGDGEGENLYTP